MMKAGLIGLGAMGTGMAYNLHKAGYLHSVWNRTSSKAAEIAASTGVSSASTIADLAAETDVIFICVSRDEDVIDVVQDISQHVKPGSTVVDTSTVSGNTATQAAKLLATNKVDFLDCPVSGGVEGAKNGSLSMMVGGTSKSLEKLRPLLAAIAANVVHIGEVGSGQACKAVNQIMCAGINQAVTEALAFGVGMNLDMDQVLKVVTKGAAGNWFLDHRGQTMLANSYDVGFKVNLHHKDLKICATMAGENAAASLPLVGRTISDYEILMDKGYGDKDISSLFLLKA